MAGDQTARRALAAAAHDRLVGSLDDVLGDRLRPTPGTRPDVYADGIVVQSFALLERCARRAAHPADDFVESAHTARRRVGLAALRRLADDASTSTGVAAAVDEVLRDGMSLPRQLTEWVEGLEPAGRATVAAAAITWAESLRRLVGPSASIRWADAASASRWDVPERLVRLGAAHDASTKGVVSGERLLLVADGTDLAADRLRAGYLGLVRSLGTRHAPTRVTLAAPSQGSLVRIDVDEALLALAVDRVVEHVSLRAAPATAPPRPGRWCGHCHLLDLCPAGQARVAAASVVGPAR